MAALPPLRRVVTGHSPDGRAVIDSDTLLFPFPPHAPQDGDATPDLDQGVLNGGFIQVWRTSMHPENNAAPWTEYHKKPIPLSDKTGTICRVVDMPPGLSSPMHRTVSLDFGVVLCGEVILELDDGLEVLVKPGDTVVQRGTIHAWHNRSEHMTRILFVLVSAEEVAVGDRVLKQTNFPVN